MSSATTIFGRRCAAALLVGAAALAMGCGGGDANSDGSSSGSSNATAARGGANAEVPSANFDLEKVLGRTVGDGGGPGSSSGAGSLGADEAATVDAFGVALPVPPPLPVRDLVVTADGLLAHARGARLFRPQDVVEGDQVEFSARLRNLSDEPLRLTRVEGECKCISARGYLLDGNERVRELWPGDDVPVGAEFEVLVHLDTSDRAGELQLEGILDYRGAAAPLKFGVLADIAAVYELAPRHALQAGVLLGRAFETRVRVTSDVADRFLLEADTRALPRHIDLAFRPQRPDADGYAREWIGTYRIAAEAPDQALLRTFEVPLVVTAAPTGPDAVPISFPRIVEVGYRTSLPVEFVQRLEAQNGRQRLVSGNAVALGVVEPGASAERRITLAVQGDWKPEEAPAVELVDVVRVGGERLPEGALTTEWIAPTEGSGPWHLVVRLENAVDDVKGPMNARFRVLLGHPDVPELNVSVSALLR